MERDRKEFHMRVGEHREATARPSAMTARLQRRLATARATHFVTGEPPRVREAGQLAWRWFIDLHSRRTYGMGGPNPISYVEIEAYARLHLWPLETCHVALICAVDAEFLRVMDARQLGSLPTARQSPPSPLTAVLFDAHWS